MAKTFYERQLKELHDRISEIQAERDALRAQVGHLNHFLVKVLLEAELLKSQLAYFDARKGGQ